LRESKIGKLKKKQYRMGPPAVNMLDHGKDQKTWEGEEGRYRVASFTEGAQREKKRKNSGRGHALWGGGAWEPSARRTSATIREGRSDQRAKKAGEARARVRAVVG